MIEKGVTPNQFSQSIENLLVSFQHQNDLEINPFSSNFFHTLISEDRFLTPCIHMWPKENLTKSGYYNGYGITIDLETFENADLGYIDFDLNFILLTQQIV